MKYEGENTIICPHCDYNHSDWWEFGVDDGEMVASCDDCGKDFELNTNISYSFDTNKIDCDKCEFSKEYVSSVVDQDTCDRWNKEGFCGKTDHNPYKSYRKDCVVCDNYEYRRVQLNDNNNPAHGRD